MSLDMKSYIVLDITFDITFDMILDTTLDMSLAMKMNITLDMKLNMILFFNHNILHQSYTNSLCFQNLSVCVITKT